MAPKRVKRGRTDIAGGENHLLLEAKIIAPCGVRGSPSLAGEDTMRAVRRPTLVTEDVFCQSRRVHILHTICQRAASSAILIVVAQE